MAIDQLLILCTMLLFLAAGFLYKARRPASIAEYTLSSRHLGWFPIAAGISMTFAGGAAILNMASLGFSFAWYTLVDPIALVIGILIVIALFERYRANNGATMASLLSGTDPYLNILLGLITTFVFILIVAAQFVALTKLVSPYFPSVRPSIITTALSVVVFSYVFFGGFRSVTRTDILQLLLIGTLLVAPVVFFILTQESTLSATSSTTPAPTPHRHSFSPMPLSYIILFAIPIAFIPLSQDINIRIKSARTKTAGVLGLSAGAAFYFAIVATSSYIGITLAENDITLSDPELAYSVFFQTAFPTFGFLGVIAALAAIVSSLDSYSLNGTTSLANDILSRVPRVQRLSPVTLLHYAAVIVYLGALIIALFFQEILALVLLALLTYISTLLPAALARFLQLRERLTLASLIFVLCVIGVVEILNFEVDPKAITYPAIALTTIACALIFQRVSRLAK